MMVGRPSFGVERPADASGLPTSRFSASATSTHRHPGAGGADRLPGRRSGRDRGRAGVGNGQTELVEVLSGMRPPTGRSITVGDTDVTASSPRRHGLAGVGRIPEDRHASLVGELSVAYSLVLERLDEFRRGGGSTSRRCGPTPTSSSRASTSEPADDPVVTLSGGNIQKVLLARVLSRDPRLLVVSQPTRGLDVGATEYVRRSSCRPPARRSGAARVGGPRRAAGARGSAGGPLRGSHRGPDDRSRGGRRAPGHAHGRARTGRLMRERLRMRSRFTSPRWSTPVLVLEAILITFASPPDPSCWPARTPSRRTTSS